MLQSGSEPREVGDSGLWPRPPQAPRDGAEAELTAQLLSFLRVGHHGASSLTSRPGFHGEVLQVWPSLLSSRPLPSDWPAP